MSHIFQREREGGLLGHATASMPGDYKNTAALYVPACALHCSAAAGAQLFARCTGHLVSCSALAAGHIRGDQATGFHVGVLVLVTCLSCDTTSLYADCQLPLCSPVGD